MKEKTECFLILNVSARILSLAFRNDSEETILKSLKRCVLDFSNFKIFETLRFRLL